MAREPPKKPKAGKSAGEAGPEKDGGDPQEPSLARRFAQLVEDRARDKRRLAARRLTATEVAALLRGTDTTDPLATIIDAEALAEAIAELPGRRRGILLAVLDKTPRKVVAKRFGLTVREVDAELQHALEHGLRHLQRGKAR